ncbi:MAG: hypothetical protein HY326_02540 [Chloroflexi bacterium]|nr:hypothetical protein [Chloroflexota bacterium]
MEESKRPPIVENEQESEKKFAHPAEEEFAHLLDFYQVRYEYEPRTFPLHWTRDGKVLEAFSPDFYLVDLDMYVELTVLQQRLITKKNRKIRRMHDLYPEVNVRLFNQKDIVNLLSKYTIRAPLGQSPIHKTNHQLSTPAREDTAAPGGVSTGEPASLDQTSIPPAQDTRT